LGERFRRYFPRVFAYAYGRTRDTRATQDLASEVFRRAFAEAHALADEAAFEARLFAIARDLLISYCQTRWEDSLENDLLPSPELARILNHLSRLGPHEQDVIALKFDAQLSDAQIAQVMELSERKVRAILYRTLRHISKALEREV